MHLTSDTISGLSEGLKIQGGHVLMWWILSSQKLEGGGVPPFRPGSYGPGYSVDHQAVAAHTKKQGHFFGL